MTRPFPRLAVPLTLVASALLTSVGAAPVKLGTLPLSVEIGTKLMVLNDTGIQKIFATGNRPDAVLLSSDKKVSLAFEWRDIKLTKSDVNVMLAQFPAVIRAQVPGIKSLNQSLITVNGSTWADFVFVAPGKAGDVRREMLITSAQDRMLVLTVSSNVADYPKSEADVKALTGSIRLN